MPLCSVRFAAPIVALALAACSGAPPRGNAACGFAMVAGPTALLDQFSIPRRTLSVPPRTVAGALVARIAAGAALPAIIGRTPNPAGSDSLLIVGLDAPLPPNTTLQFGVLVADPTSTARGVMLYETPPVQGAPILGSIAIGTKTLPLLGLETDLAGLELKDCPFFPDSILRR